MRSGLALSSTVLRAIGCLIAPLLTFSGGSLRMESVTNKIRNRLLWAAFASAIGVSSIAVARDVGSGVVALTPDQLRWAKQGAFALAGMEQVNLIGDSSKPGPYTMRLKFPKGLKVAPHTHPDSREVTIISGVFTTGYGETFDASKLKVLPAGSFYTEPANVPHYIEIKEDVVLQVSGTGPSGRNYINPPDGAK
jgi:hypothetical protein